MLEVNSSHLITFQYVKEDSKVHKSFSYTITFPYFIQEHKIQIKQNVCYVLSLLLEVCFKTISKAWVATSLY